MRWGVLAGLFGAMLSVVAQVVPPPPAVHVVGASIPAPHVIQGKGLPTVYSIGTPSDDEQLMLELINRARLDPVAEALRLATVTNSELTQTYAHFGVNLNAMYNAVSALPPAPPLAMNAALSTAARLHSGWMLTNISQSHYETNGTTLVAPLDRIVAQGYSPQNYGENIYSSGTSAFQSHVGFEVDWGFGPDGMQNPPGHRLNNHRTNFNEVGIGFFYGNASIITTNGFTTNLVSGVPTVTPILAKTFAGPDSVTVDFGQPNHSQAFLSGVAYYDLDGDQFYGLGEGLGGLAVTATDVTGSAITAASGGYSLPVPNGAHNVSFSLPGYISPPIPVTVADGQNVKVDLVLPYVAPVLTGPGLALAGGQNVYAASTVPVSTGYEWQVTQGVPYTAVEGAENGTGNIITNVSGYSVISTDFAASGTSSFHLVHVTRDPQIVTLKPVLKVFPGAKVNFATQFGFATTNEFTSFDLSTNSGVSWVSIWKRTGFTTLNQSDHAFTNTTVDLGDYAGLNISARFSFVAGSTFFNKFQKGYGVYWDNISFTNVESLNNPVIASAATDGTFNFTPAANGKFYLSARPVVGSRSFPFGPELAVTATNHVVPSATTRAVSIAMGGVNPNKLQIEYRVLTGTAGGFQLQQAIYVTGPWQPTVGVVVTTNGSGNRIYAVNPASSFGFFRLLAQ